MNGNEKNKYKNTTFYFFFASSLEAATVRTSDFQKNIVSIPKGVHYLKDIEMLENTIIRGENKFLSIIKLKPSAQKALFYSIDKSNIDISNLTLINEQNDPIPLILFEGKSKEVRNITIKNCILKVTNAETDVLIFRKKISNILISNNIIHAKKDSTIRRDYTQTSCIKLDGSSLKSKNSSSIIIKSNLLKYGNCGFRIVGTGTPANPLLFEGNIIQGQIGSGAIFYHGLRQKIINNYFSDIIAVSMKNNDGGVVWLDGISEGSILFSGNTIENNYGNGIFIEELKSAIITDNLIQFNKKRVSDEYNVISRGIKNSSKGGNGILVTGGVNGLKIKDNQIRNNENNGIFLNTKLGVHDNYDISLLSIENNIIAGNEKFAVKLTGKAKNVYVKDNIIISYKQKFFDIKHNKKSINYSHNWNINNILLVK